MHIEQSFRISSMLLVAAGFTGLTLAARVPSALLAVGFAALFISLAHAAGWGFASLYARLSGISTTAWNVLMVLAFLICAADLIWFSQDLLVAGGNFLTALMVNKVFNLHHRKDYLYLYAISFLMLLATASLTIEAWYALIFISYLLAAIWTLLLYHLKNEVEESRGPGSTGGSASAFPLTARFFWTTNAIAVLALFLTLAIFYVTPRAGAGFFQQSRGEPIRTSGFSQQVDLGVIGSIKLDPTVVMRVEFPDQTGPTEGRVYLQGAVYDHYTSRSWMNTLSRRRAVGQIYPGSFLVSRDQNPRAGESPIRQNILIEVLDAPVLFGVPVIERVEGAFPLLQTDEIGGLHLPYPPSTRFQYTVFSLANRLEEEDKTAPSLEYPSSLSSRFLQLPPLSRKVRALALDVTRNASTPYERAVAVKWHLLGGYTYSLDVGTKVSDHPVEDFLFERKTGYCEHYATAMVLMLRTLDIPARLVTGFLAGEWNDFGGYYTVRQQDAHAWVEVFFPGSGWIIFDPTPSVVATPRNSPLERVASLLDSFRVKWTRFVIEYSFKDQRAVLHGLRERSEPVRSRASEWLTTALKVMRNWRDWFLGHVHGWSWRHLTGVLVVLGLLVATVFLGRRRRWMAVPSELIRYTPAQLAAARVYERMLQLLGQQGVIKPVSAGPLEFADRVSEEWTQAAPLVQPITELYCRGRFSTTPLSTDDLRSADSLLAQLRGLLDRSQEEAQPVGSASPP